MNPQEADFQFLRRALQNRRIL